MQRSWGGAAAVLLALLGCQAPDRPPPVRDAARPPGGDSLVDPSEVPTPGPSPCGAATVELEFVRPNLYFVIDASGSMLENIPPGVARTSMFAPTDRYRTLAQAIQSLLLRVGHRVNYGATLFPSADQICDAGEEVLALTPGDRVSFAVSGERGPVLQRLMFAINRRTPQGGTPVGAALTGLLPRLRGRDPETYVFLVTDGGPNCNAELSCDPSACIPNIERLRLSEQLICEAPLNCCDDALFGRTNCLDDASSRDAVLALADAGVRTFVIGMPGSEAYAEVLDGLAESGGLARAASPLYYRVGDAQELSDTVSALGLQVALGCTIELAETPPDPEQVNLFFDGQLIPADPIEGWIFSDPDTVQVVGEACLLMQSGDVLQADVVAGCPVVIR
jgi:hypothetical protein